MSGIPRGALSGVPSKGLRYGQNQVPLFYHMEWTGHKPGMVVDEDRLSLPLTAYEGSPTFGATNAKLEAPNGLKLSVNAPADPSTPPFLIHTIGQFVDVGFSDSTRYRIEAGFHGVTDSVPADAAWAVGLQVKAGQPTLDLASDARMGMTLKFLKSNGKRIVKLNMGGFQNITLASPVDLSDNDYRDLVGSGGTPGAHFVMSFEFQKASGRGRASISIAGRPPVEKTGDIVDLTTALRNGGVTLTVGTPAANSVTSTQVYCEYLKMVRL